jgi:acylaminoacyl-peptidase
MNYDGSNPHQVTHLTLQQGAAQRPAWSPDGQLLAFQANATTPRVKATLWIIDLKTSGAREVLPHDNSYRDEAPSWFSGGKRLAFQSNRSGKTEVWAVDTDNTDLQQLTGKR